MRVILPLRQQQQQQQQQQQNTNIRNSPCTSAIKTFSSSSISSSSNIEAHDSTDTNNIALDRNTGSHIETDNQKIASSSSVCSSSDNLHRTVTSSLGTNIKSPYSSNTTHNISVDKTKSTTCTNELNHDQTLATQTEKVIIDCDQDHSIPTFHTNVEHTSTASDTVYQQQQLPQIVYKKEKLQSCTTTSTTEADPSVTTSILEEDKKRKEIVGHGNNNNHNNFDNNIIKKKHKSSHSPITMSLDENYNESAGETSHCDHSLTQSRQGENKVPQQFYDENPAEENDVEDKSDDYCNGSNTDNNVIHICNIDKESHTDTHQGNYHQSESSSLQVVRRNNNNHLSEFELALRKRGLELVEQDGDGNCLFRAVSYQVYGDANSHLDVRKRCMDFMAKDEAHFAQFVVGEPFHDYVRRKRRNGVHGNNPEIQAISELYNRPVEIFVPENGEFPINIFHADYKTCDVPIRLSYHDGEHYNAVIDPFTPTAGLGLGLPGLEPGLADRMQIQQAVDESDKLHVQKIAEEAYDMDMQRVMMESKMSYIKEAEGSLKPSSWNSNTSSHKHHHHNHHQRAGDRRRRQGQQQRSTSPNYSNYNTYNCCSSSTSHNDNDVHSSSQVAHLSTTSVHSSVAAATSYDREIDIPSHLLYQDGEEYPRSVQELVMNGFELQKVLKAFDLVGDNFDELLAFLMNSGS